jgi:nitrite reductase/ring-hydroxylating ferredoxin subunit
MPAAAVRAHYNVCRHRGSRVLLEAEGNARALTCRYHGWTYATDGRLLSARRMREDFKPECHGLAPCALRIVEGLIFVSLADGEGPALDAVVAGLAPYLRLHGIADARVAHRAVYARQCELEAHGRELPRVLSLQAGASAVLQGRDQGRQDRGRIARGNGPVRGSARAVAGARDGARTDVARIRDVARDRRSACRSPSSVPRIARRCASLTLSATETASPARH